MLEKNPRSYAPSDGIAGNLPASHAKHLAVFHPPPISPPGRQQDVRSGITFQLHAPCPASVLLLQLLNSELLPPRHARRPTLHFHKALPITGIGLPSPVRIDRSELSLLPQTIDMTAQLQSTPRHLAFISLALGFLVIWTAVLAGVLVSRTLKDEASAKETTKVFHTHEDVGKILFALGHELVSTVDWMLSTADKTNVDSIAVTWKITNSMMSKMKEETSDRRVASVISMLDILQERLTVFRETVSDVKSNPPSTVKFYLDLSDWVLQRCFLMDYAGQHLPVPSLPYTLFVRGMAQRFGELALGTIYVKSDMPINTSEFLKLRTGSEELMEASFHFIPRARTKWMELQEQEPGVHKVMEAVVEDMLSGSSLRGQKELANEYLDGVKEQIAKLLLTKEVLNASLLSFVERLSQRSHNTLAFHMSIAIVAVVAVILCLIVTTCSFSYFSKGQPDVETHNSQMPYSVLEKPVLSSNMKPQCYM